MRKNKKRKGMDYSNMRCPYCGGRAQLRNADGIYKDNSRGMMLYVCENYPECDIYVRTHAGTCVPVGSMANQELRILRRTAHHYFDRLHTSGLMSREEAYLWLAEQISAPLSEAHIGHLGEYYCKEVIRKSKEMLARQEQRKKVQKLRKERPIYAIDTRAEA